MKIKRIDHLGVIVKDLDKSIAFLKEHYGIEKTSIIDWTVKKDLEGNPTEPYKLRMCFIPFDNITLELMEVLEGKSPYADYQGIDGEGIHHICINVEDIDDEIKEYEDKGIKAFDTGKIAGSPFAYFDTQGRCGFLIEALQTRTRKRKKEP